MTIFCLNAPSRLPRASPSLCAAQSASSSLRLIPDELISPDCDPSSQIGRRADPTPSPPFMPVATVGWLVARSHIKWRRRREASKQSRDSRREEMWRYIRTAMAYFQSHPQLPLCRVRPHPESPSSKQISGRLANQVSADSALSSGLASPRHPRVSPRPPQISNPVEWTPVVRIEFTLKIAFS